MTGLDGPAYQAALAYLTERYVQDPVGKTIAHIRQTTDWAYLVVIYTDGTFTLFSSDADPDDHWPKIEMNPRWFLNNLGGAKQALHVGVLPEEMRAALKAERSL